MMPSSNSSTNSDTGCVLRLPVNSAENSDAGDPMADLIAIWQALDQFHQTHRLTEECWSFLGDRLQRPIEMRLLERQPVTLAGAAAALDLAAHIMDQLDGCDASGDRAWYRRVRQHLLHSARDFIRHQAQQDLSLEPRHLGG